MLFNTEFEALLVVYICCFPAALGRYEPPQCRTPPLELDIDNFTLSITPGCATCRGRCGQKSDYRTERVCSCDHRCEMYRDCCPDFTLHCSAQKESMVQREGHIHVTCREVPISEGYGMISYLEFEPYLFISSCPNDTTGAECRQSEENPSTYVPAYDITTGVHYLTYRCAVCNGARHVLPWTTFINCNDEQLPEELRRSNLSETMSRAEFQQLWTLALGGWYGCKVYHKIRADMEPPRPCFAEVVNKPRECHHCGQPEIHEACYQGNLVYTAYQQDAYSYYPNIMCLLCDRGAYDIDTDSPCMIMQFPLAAADPELFAFSFQLLFDVDLREGLTVGKSNPSDGSKPPSNVICPYGQIWVPEETSCRHKVCLTSNCTAAQVSLQITFPNNYNLVNESLVAVQNNLSTLLHSTFSNVGIVSFTPQNDNTLIGHITVYETENSTAVSDDLYTMLTHYFNRITPGVEIFVNSENDRLLDKLRGMNCSVLYYSSTEYRMENGSVTLFTGRKVSKGHYVIDDNFTVYVCAKQFDQELEWTGSIGQGVLTIVLTSLSIIALLIRLVLHFFVPVLDRVSVSIQLSLVVALLVAMLSFLVHPLLSSHRVVCYIIAVTIHFSFLAAFSWMTVTALDIMRMLLASRNLRKIGSRNVSFIVYSLFAWGLPLVIVSLTVGIDYSGLPWQWRPHYGKSLCWITSRYGLLVYFVAPAVVEFALNVTFFIISAVLLYKNTATPSGGNTTSTSASRQRLFLHVKLLVLMGITWVIGFLAVPLQSDALWYLFIILNASQGVLLLVTYVASHGVRQHLCTRRKKPKDSHKSSGTGSTSL